MPSEDPLIRKAAEEAKASAPPPVAPAWATSILLGALLASVLALMLMATAVGVVELYRLIQ